MSHKLKPGDRVKCAVCGHTFTLRIKKKEHGPNYRGRRCQCGSANIYKPEWFGESLSDISFSEKKESEEE